MWGNGFFHSICKAPTSQSGGFSRQTLKMAGQQPPGHWVGLPLKSGWGHSVGQDMRTRFYNPEGQVLHNQSDWRRYRNAAGPGHGPMSNILLTLGSMVPFFLGD
uniref:Uncharacterized protein n=1 Tax=Hucho hucho TaxID=62062 RepID=A0A4W5P7Y6_9TELE